MPGPGSRYVTELEELAGYLLSQRRRLPRMVWMDTTPQHFPKTGYYTGEFHAAACAPWAAWERGDAVPRAGGMWNVAAAPFVHRLADAHLRTWDASVPFWSTHMPSECTHWCQPSVYHVWLYLLNGALRDAALGDRVAVRPAPMQAAAAAQAEQQHAAAGTTAKQQ